MHTVDIVRLRGASVVVGNQDCIHIILVHLPQVALARLAVNRHGLRRGIEDEVGILRAVVGSRNEVVLERIVEQKRVDAEIEADILLRVRHDGGDEFLVQLRIVALVGRNLIGIRRVLMLTQVYHIKHAILGIPQASVNPCATHIVVALELEGLAVAVIAAPPFFGGLTGRLRVDEVGEGADIHADIRGVHVNPVPRFGHTLSDGIGRVFLSSDLAGLAAVEIKLLQTRIEPALIIGRIGDTLGTVLVGDERHTHVGQVVVVVRALDHREHRMQRLDIAPSRFVHLAGTEVAATTEHRLVTAVCLREEEYWLGVFRHTSRGNRLLDGVAPHN